MIVCAVLGHSESPATPKSSGGEPLRLAVARIPSLAYNTESPSETSDEANDTMRELRMLASLGDPNLARVIGLVRDLAEPARPWTIIEYTELGDLAHYLQYSEPLVGTQRPSCSLNFIRSV